MIETARFITLEGGEGAGKSTQARKLVQALESANIACIQTREPGGSPGAEHIRKLLVEGTPGRWDALSETLMMFAARADHLAKTIAPALQSGKWVICDRFIDSTYAYQGAGRGLAAERIAAIEAAATQGFRPDLTLVLDIPVSIGLSRAHARPGIETRFEQFDLSFHERLRSAFLNRARTEPGRCVIVDATGDQDVVAQRIWDVVQQRLLR